MPPVAIAATVVLGLVAAWGFIDFVGGFLQWFGAYRTF